ncbi:MAG TPA: hypothetical protein VIL87_09270 [Dermatophilaceae bacterium]|jgi:hypothetical protein
MKVHSKAPKAFIWTAMAESILTKVRRGRVALSAVESPSAKQSVNDETGH